MAYPQTQTPNTQHVVWYSHSIHVNGIEIGSFQRLSVRSTRNTESIREILFSRGPEIKEIVWGGTDTSLDLSRAELYQKAMFEAFGFEIFSLEDFNQPVNITEIQVNPLSNGKRVLTYVDCVASDIGKSVDSSTAHIVEDISFQVRTIRGRRVS